MIRLRARTNAFFLLLACITFPAWSSEPSTEALAVIEELGLREAASPVSERPGWQPRRVAVAMPFGMRGDGAAYRAALAEVAGDVELVFNNGNPFMFSEEALKGADAVIGMCLPQVLERVDSTLFWLHNYSVGMDLCKGLSEQQRENVLFTNNQRLSAPAIAEHTIAMLLSLSRNLPAYTRNQSLAKWDRSPAKDVTFGELQGKTLLVVGLGGIGTEIARRADGLGMRVIATRNSSRSGPEFVEYVGLSGELLDLAARADIVANALPLTEKTTGIFDAAFFEALKPGAIFLSVGRGKSTVTADLVAALESGHVFAAGLDVTDPEPLPADSPLWRMDNVLITPHTSSAGAESSQRSQIIAVENLRRYVAGEPMLNVVDIERGY